MAKDQCIIFYSWASDHPSGSTRAFIETALQRAISDLHSDETITVVPVIDRDTQGVPGSPDIASTIFGKIDQAQIFVCDVSIVDSNAQRPSPNPNVLIELGYALKVLGQDRIIMVMNTAFGKPELLPFDLRTRRVTQYDRSPGTDDQGAERKKLPSTLTDALRTILQGIDPLSEQISLQTPAQIAHLAVEANHPDKNERVRQYMDGLGEQVAIITPKRASVGQSQKDQLEDDLRGAINMSVPIALEFTQLAQMVAVHKDANALSELYEGFSHILDLYDNPYGFQGSYLESDFDFPRFIGHELFVTFCALLMRGKQWDTLANLLSRDIYVTNGKNHEPGMRSYNALSEYVRLLDNRNSRMNPRHLSVHADLLNQRHSGEGMLTQALPMVLFTEADYFLFLRGQLEADEELHGVRWRPWSYLYMRSTPRFLIESVSKSLAQPLAQALGVSSISELRSRLSKRIQSLNEMFGDAFGRDPLDGFDPQTIGTR